MWQQSSGTTNNPCVRRNRDFTSKVKQSKVKQNKLQCPLYECKLYNSLNFPYLPPNWQDSWLSLKGDCIATKTTAPLFCMIGMKTSIMWARLLKLPAERMISQSAHIPTGKSDFTQSHKTLSAMSRIKKLFSSQLFCKILIQLCNLLYSSLLFSVLLIIWCTLQWWDTLKNETYVQYVSSFKMFKKNNRNPWWKHALQSLNLFPSPHVSANANININISACYEFLPIFSAKTFFFSTFWIFFWSHMFRIITTEHNTMQQNLNPWRLPGRCFVRKKWPPLILCRGRVGGHT